MMELGQSISIEDWMSGLFATEPYNPLNFHRCILRYSINVVEFL
jgi:hypothetical protein